MAPYEGTEGSEPLDVAYSTNQSVTGRGLFLGTIKKSSSRGQEAARLKKFSMSILIFLSKILLGSILALMLKMCPDMVG